MPVSMLGTEDAVMDETKTDSQLEGTDYEKSKKKFFLTYRL